jgi:ribulose-phosphate 3-epimerase
MTKISVSILSKNDDETILNLNKTNADYIHIDVMDGKFVYPVSFSMPRIDAISKISNKKLDVHLMVENPDFYIDILSKLNVDYITFHYEVLNSNLDIIKKIKNRGIKCGLSVKPITDIKDTFYLLDDIDLILIMSVEPGYGGQDFMISVLEKVKLLREEITRRNLKTIIAIDGGINGSNAKLCTSAGCDMLVVGSYITNSNNYQLSIDSLKS